MEKPLCQSCAMPLAPEDYGTNKDGSPNGDYCKYCYENGAFTSEETIESMIECCVPHMVGPEMTEEQARGILQAALPALKRWQKA